MYHPPPQVRVHRIIPQNSVRQSAIFPIESLLKQRLNLYDGVPFWEPSFKSDLSVEEFDLFYLFTRILNAPRLG